MLIGVSSFCQINIQSRRKKKASSKCLGMKLPKGPRYTERLNSIKIEKQWCSKRSYTYKYIKVQGHAVKKKCIIALATILQT